MKTFRKLLKNKKSNKNNSLNKINRAKSNSLKNRLRSKSKSNQIYRGGSILNKNTQEKKQCIDSVMKGQYDNEIFGELRKTDVPPRLRKILSQEEKNEWLRNDRNRVRRINANRICS